MNHGGSYLSTTPSDTTRSNSTSPIKLPLQMTAATTTTTRSWLGDPDGVQMSDLRGKVGGVSGGREALYTPPTAPQRALVLVPQQASQVLIPPTPTHAPTLSPLGDEESRPGSRDSEWNSTHPCYPHRNPYVPIDSPLYESTRIIRISRDFMAYGDLAPAYSNVFPDILEPHVTEEQFREVVAWVNGEMKRAFDPWSPWNWVDAVLGLLTLWIWEDVVEGHAKRVLREVEAYLEGWNERLRRGGQSAVFISLRRSGYMNLDIQIPDPIPSIDDEESKYVDDDVSETGSTIGPLGSEAGQLSLRMNSMNGRGSSGRMGSLGSGEYSNDGYR